MVGENKLFRKKMSDEYSVSERYLQLVKYVINNYTTHKLNCSSPYTGVCDCGLAKKVKEIREELERND